METQLSSHLLNYECLPTACVTSPTPTCISTTELKSLFLNYIDVASASLRFNTICPAHFGTLIYVLAIWFKLYPVFSFSILCPTTSAIVATHASISPLFTFVGSVSLMDLFDLLFILY